MRISILGFIIGLIVQIAAAQTVHDPLPRRGRVVQDEFLSFLSGRIGQSFN